MQLLQFEDIVERALTFEKGSDVELRVNYLKDVSLLLSLVSAVRECNIQQHLQAKRNIIYLAFAYGHQNYARYNIYQNVYLSHLKQIDHPAFHDLKNKGIGGRITGEKFLQSMAIYLQNCSTKRLNVMLVCFILYSVQTLIE